MGKPQKEEEGLGGGGGEAEEESSSLLSLCFTELLPAVVTGGSDTTVALGSVASVLYLPTVMLRELRAYQSSAASCRLLGRR